MAIKAQIIILNKSVKWYLKLTDLSDNEKLLYDPQYIIKYKKICEILTAISNLEIVDVIIARPDKDIMKRILAISANNKVDVIFITGDINSADRSYVNNAIEAIIIKTEKLSTNLAKSIINIETKLENIIRYRSVCGIRDKTLIINLPDTHDSTCVAAIADILTNTLHLIRENDDQNKMHALSLCDDNFSEQARDEDTYESLYCSEVLPDSSSSSCDATADSSNNFPEQKKNEDGNESLRRSETFEESSSSSSSSSSTVSSDSVIYNTVNRHKEWVPLISLENALKMMFDLITDIENTESVKISDAYGRILYNNVHSIYNMPPFRTSKKHGYAVLVSDGKGMRQVLDNKNKFPPISLQRGTCVWVNSGAPVPNEATAVVGEKDTKRMKSLDDDKVYIEIMSKPLHGQNINPIGYNIMKGNIILNKYTRIGPEEIGVLAASGCKEVTVIKQLSIGVLSIGNNLEEPGKPLKPGYTYDISRIILISLLKDNGFSSFDFGIINNTQTSILKNIDKALHKVDILVTSGYSNDKDILKRILLEYIEAEIHFGNVDIKPGKSTTLATCTINNKIKYILCLSGNPVTAFITAQVFLLPLLRKLYCREHTENAILPVSVDRPFILHHRPRLACVYLKWSNETNVATTFSTGNLFKDRLCNMAGSNALLLLPESLEWKPLSKEYTKLPALLIDYPGKFLRPLPNPNLFDVKEYN